MLKNRIAVNILFWVNGFVFANYTSRLPQVQSIYGLNDGDIGITLLVMAIGALIAMPLTGWLIVKTNSQQIASISAPIFCLLIPLISFLPNFFSLNIVFFLIGLSTGAMDIGMNAQAVVVEKIYRKPIMSSFHALFSAGMMSGALFGSFFIWLDSDLIWHLTTATSVGVLLVIWSIPHLVNDENRSTSKEQHGFSLPRASLLGVGCIAFCCMLSEGAMANWSTNYMLNIAQADAFTAPLGLVAFSSAMMLARFFGDRVRVFLGDRKLLITNSFMAGIGMGMVVLLPYPIFVLIGLFLVGLGLSVIIPIVYSTAGNTPNLPPGVGISMVSTIGYSGLLLGPPIIGFLAEWQNMQIAMSFTLFLFVLMMILSYRFRATNPM